MSHRTLAFVALLLAAGMLSCATSSNPNIGRVLTSIQVTPTTADAQTYPNGQVVFTATGSFSLPPSPSVLTFASPYVGSFVVNNPTSGPVADIISTDAGTATLQCVSGATGSVEVVASAASNSPYGDVVSAFAQLTCP